MVKKRSKARWIVGGVLGFIVLFFVTALVMESNSQDARLERALSQIIVEQGFELDPYPTVNFLGLGSFDSYAIYEGKPISQEDERQIVALFREACPSCSLDVTKDESAYDVLMLVTDESSNIGTIIIIFDDKGQRTAGSLPASKMTVFRGGASCRKSLLNKLWPW